MFKFGKEYKPYKAEFRGTNNTVFVLPQYHKDQQGNFCKDGFLNVMSKGTYELGAEDKIIVYKEDASGIGIQKYGQYQNMTLYVSKVEVVRAVPKEVEKNIAILEDDIPDDLF